MKIDKEKNITFEPDEVKLTYLRDVFYEIKLPNNLSHSERLNLIKNQLHQLDKMEFSSREEHDCDLPSNIQISLIESNVDDCLLEIKLDSNNQYQLFYDDEIIV